jgi:cell division septum initiation protein DivIVA
MAAGEPAAGVPGSLAASASQRVQAILEAAEASAADIRRDAEAEAAAVRERAHADAGRATASIEATLRRLEELHGDAQDHAAPVAPAGDIEGARLVALDMALAGRPREETARHLAAHFALTDSGTLLDEVYASVGG